jgi:hypothetical protein
VARPSILNDTSTEAITAAHAVERLLVLVETLLRIVVLFMSRVPVGDRKLTAR